VRDWRLKYGQFTFHGSFTSKIAAAKKERNTPGSFIIERGGRYYVMKPKKRVDNPRKYLTRIYGRVLEIHAQKTGPHRNCDAECKRANHKYVHDYQPGAKLMGIPDGAFLMLKDGRTIRLSNGSMLVSDKEY
jgi:hypothetical protein